MSGSTRFARAERAVVVGLFGSEAQARQALEALGRLGVPEERVDVLAPGETIAGSNNATGPLARAAITSGDSGTKIDLSQVLASLGVPEGESRFYAEEATQGRTLLVVDVVDADGRFDAVRQVVLEHGGYDVQSQGRDLIRGDTAAAAPSVRTELPVDVTSTWRDFRSRYEMLWQQHYGTTDATFEQMEPIYRYAWQLANEPRYRGRPWTEVESAVHRDWDTSGLAASVPWSEAAGPIRDVWEDVTQEAASGAEGGADRRIAHQGTDQSVAARDVRPPRQGAA